MFKFTKTGVFCVLFFIIFCLIQTFIHQFSFQTEINEEIMQIIEETPVVQTLEKTEIWQIKIPRISLIAPISEGTTKEIIAQKVGHFENTSKTQGNVGLALINKNLKLLQNGDEIIYNYNGFEKIYVVEKCRIIRDTEKEYLEETEDNMLTIITYIENESEYRRCIQAIEKEEE